MKYKRAGGGQVEHQGHDRLAGNHPGQAAAQDHDQGVDGVAEGVFPGDNAFGQTFGAGGLDVLHVEHIQQVGAHHPAQPGCAAGANHHDRDPHMAEQVQNLAKLQGAFT